jgi:hypothetical protein
VLNIFDGMAQESLSESAELVDRIGGEEFEAGKRPLFGRVRWSLRQKLPQMSGDSVRGGLS